MLTTEARRVLSLVPAWKNKKRARWAFYDAPRPAASQQDARRPRRCRRHRVGYAEVPALKTYPGAAAGVLRRSPRHGSADAGRRRHGIYVINHDGVKIIAPFLPSRPDINVLCIDELATYRNWNKRTKLMRLTALRFEWAWGMTGSPTPNRRTSGARHAQIDARARRALDALPPVVVKMTGFKYAPSPARPRWRSRRCRSLPGYAGRSRRAARRRRAAGAESRWGQSRSKSTTISSTRARTRRRTRSPRRTPASC